MDMRDVINKFFSSMNFKLKESITSDYFQDYYDIYTNGRVNFRLVNDRSTLSIDIGINNQNWYDLVLVKLLLYGKINLNSGFTIEEYYSFLQVDFVKIIELFDDNNYLITKNKLEELMDKRARQLFPEVRK